MIRWYLRHIFKNLYKHLRFFFWQSDLDSLLVLRYDVLSGIGYDQLKDIIYRMEENKKIRGHMGYWEAVKSNHEEFYKKEYTHE